MLAMVLMGSDHAAVIQAQHNGSAVPLAAQALADNLGIRGKPFVGNQPDGEGRPWTVWFPRLIRHQWLGPGGVPRRYLEMTGPALFAGPRGAAGEYHYFNRSPLVGPYDSDTYQGPKLGHARVLRMAYGWLRRSGTPIPHGHLRVQLGSGTTIIGGTGLCCFKVLDVVSWGGTPNRWGNVWNAQSDVYIADAGTVVQADIGPLFNTSGYGFSTPCRGRARRNSAGIALGSWCFNYRHAVRTMIVGDIGNHSPWVDDPRMMAQLVGRDHAIQHKYLSHTHQVSLTPYKAVYTQTYQGMPYRMTFIAAFPGLTGSIWELARIQRL